jgi:signal transduction histidine kinase
MPTKRYAGWLPPIESRGATGWFPLKTSSLPAIIGGLASTDAADTLASSWRDAFSNDPALLIYSAVQLNLAGGVASHQSCSLESLTRWWLEQGREVWRATDWLAAPEPSLSQTMFARYAKLDDYFRTLPLQRWLNQAGLWFDTAGIANPIAAESSLNWPSEVVDSNHSESAHLSIAAWVRATDQQQIQNKTFRAAIEKHKRELAHTLAYGLSHEINNPLANISTRAQAMMLRGNQPVEFADSLQRIVDQTSRAHAMIADLMFYAKPPEIRCREFDLISRLKTVIASFAGTSARLGIEIGLVATGETCVLNADEEMIGELIAVLVKNSIEAIGCDGRIEVDVTHTESQMEVRVADSGPGITVEQAAMAMDPYYSGREAGRGLGLGLCRADRIARLHGGELSLAPALAGCVATLRLPVA